MLATLRGTRHQWHLLAIHSVAIAGLDASEFGAAGIIPHSLRAHCPTLPAQESFECPIENATRQGADDELFENRILCGRIAQLGTVYGQRMPNRFRDITRIQSIFYQTQNSSQAGIKGLAEFGSCVTSQERFCFSQTRVLTMPGPMMMTFIPHGLSGSASDPGRGMARKPELR